MAKYRHPGRDYTDNMMVRELREYDVEDLVALLDITSDDIISKFPSRVRRYLKDQEIPELAYRYAEEDRDEDDPSN